MIGRDTENETGPAVLMRRREKGREEIRDTNKDIENEGYHGGPVWNVITLSLSLSQSLQFLFVVFSPSV